MSEYKYLPRGLYFPLHWFSKLSLRFRCRISDQNTDTTTYPRSFAWQTAKVCMETYTKVRLVSTFLWRRWLVKTVNTHNGTLFLSSFLSFKDVIMSGPAVGEGWNDCMVSARCKSAVKQVDFMLRDVIAIVHDTTKNAVTIPCWHFIFLPLRSLWILSCRQISASNVSSSTRVEEYNN